MTRPEDRLTEHEYGALGRLNTPVEEIPPEFQRSVTLRSGEVQILDNRLCYAFVRDGHGGRYIESAITANDAQHFLNESPQSQAGV